MCGIIGFIPKNNKNRATGKPVIEQYQRQLTRGQRGFGLMSIYPNKVVIDRATEPTKIIVDTYMSEAPIKFFHHRMPTSTENELEQTHPFLVNHDELEFDYYLLHNGVIRNADELMKMHTEELGYVYKTLKPLTSTYGTYASTYKRFNDSEALAIEAARYFDGKGENIGALGTIAFVMVRMTKKTHKPVDLIWSRNGGNPIEMVQTKEGLLIASEVYHDDAELVPENTFEIIDLNKYFASKKAFPSIIKLIKAGEADYKVPPPPPAPVIPARTTTSSMGFGTHSVPAKSETTATTTNLGKDDERDFEATTTPRERAFLKMADRVILDISEHIYNFFEELAYEEVSDDEIMQIANELNDLLLEKSETAKDKVRPHFDAQEANEHESLLAYDDFPEAHAAEEDDELVPYRSTLSVNERADNSRKRFEEIVD